jgi:hypothetical protein
MASGRIDAAKPRSAPAAATARARGACALPARGSSTSIPVNAKKCAATSRDRVVAQSEIEVGDSTASASAVPAHASRAMPDSKAARTSSSARKSTRFT